MSFKKNLKFIILIFLFIFTKITFAFDNLTEENNVPAGMKKIKIGAQVMIVPKDAKVKKNGSAIIVEDFGEYATRKFVDIENRILLLEEKQNELNQKIIDLQKLLKELSNKINNLVDNSQQ